MISFLQHTLMWMQQKEQHADLRASVEQALRYLTEKDLLKLERDPKNEEDVQIKITNLGKAVYKGLQ